MTATATPTLQRARPRQTYQAMIVRQLTRRNRPETIDPRHVEAWMRDANAALDRLTVEQFTREVDTAIAMIAHAGERQSEMLARSFGL